VTDAKIAGFQVSRAAATAMVRDRILIPQIKAALTNPKRKTSSRDYVGGTVYIDWAGVVAVTVLNGTIVHLSGAKNTGETREQTIEAEQLRTRTPKTAAVAVRRPRLHRKVEPSPVTVTRISKGLFDPDKWLEECWTKYKEIGLV
jgi:hypothetical protein